MAFIKKISATIIPILLCLHTSFALMIITARAADPYLGHYCPNTTTFSPNKTFHSNLRNLLSALSSHNTPDNGFYNATIGVDNPGSTVYGLYLCRGDVAPDVCRDCVSVAAEQVLEMCPVEMDSVIWLDKCMLRYSNKSFFSTAEVEPPLYIWYWPNISDQNRFMPLVADTMEAVAKEAAKAAKKFATKEAQFNDFQNLYTLAQCTPDLSAEDCSRCLDRAISTLPNCCNGMAGARVLAPSCNVRYGMDRFYQVPEEERPKGKGRISTLIIIAIAVPIVVSLLLSFLGCWLIRSRKKHGSISKENDEISMEFLQFDLDTIKAATNNFSDDNKLGEGGFGEVYKGSLANGQVIAVKRLSRSSRQGAKEFKNEVVLVAKLQHRNLVRLLGFCLDGEEKILIYEFVTNKSLDYFLFDPLRCAQLDWTKRYKILGDIARGLLYLHEDSRLRIIHRDLKASNILLDQNMNAKISDFGIAKLFVTDQTRGNTQNVKGTLGYMAPEYVIYGNFSMKSDIFSFGVLILEIITGCKNNSIFDEDYSEHLVSFAWRKWKEGAASNIIDPKLNNGSQNEIMRCFHIGLLCVQENAADRPTMAAVVLMLNSPSYTLPMPSEPAFFMHGSLPHMQPWQNNSGQTGSSESKSVQESTNENDQSHYQSATVRQHGITSNF